MSHGWQSWHKFFNILKIFIEVDETPVMHYSWCRATCTKKEARTISLDVLASFLSSLSSNLISSNLVRRCHPLRLHIPNVVIAVGASTQGDLCIVGGAGNSLICIGHDVSYTTFGGEQPIRCGSLYGDHMIAIRPCLKNKSCTNGYDLVNYWYGNETIWTHRKWMESNQRYAAARTSEGRETRTPGKMW